MLNGKDKQGRDLEFYAEWQPDLYETLMQSIILDRQGSGAAHLYGFPTDNEEWRGHQMLLSMLWKDVDYQLSMAGISNRSAMSALAYALGLRKQ